MKEQFYKVSLLSDVVLNSSLATEGNMTTLDYIPGSNFLGILAAKLYNSAAAETAYTLFHSGKLRFGDATIAKNDQLSYPIPAMLFMDKINNEIGKDPVFLDYLIDRENPPSLNGANLQLKQWRSGYLLQNGEIIKELPKSFAIKSAQERTTRTAKDGAMFGFESLNKGLEFLFSVQAEESDLLDMIHPALEGTHRLGKSKNAEFGQIHISKVAPPKTIDTFTADDFVLVYAQTNLCFTDANGAPTFQPTVAQLGFTKGEIDWSKSQIRSYSYSPWNFKRNTSNSQRNCIAKGSVFFISNATKNSDANTIGLHQAEGLGKVIYNPAFLAGNKADAKCNFEFYEQNYKEEKTKDDKPATTLLSKFLEKKLTERTKDRSISDVIQKLIYTTDADVNKLKKISSSQWGGIRAYATKTKNWDELQKQLFDKDLGYLTHGVADEKYWGRNRGANLTAFKKIVDANKQYGTQFIAKFAAEMAKESRKSNKNTH